MFVYPVIKKKSDNSRRQTGYKHLEPHHKDISLYHLAEGCLVERMGIAFSTEWPELFPENDNNSHYGAELYDNIEHFLEFIRLVEIQEFLHKDKMSRTADG